MPDRRADFERFVNDSSDSLLRAAYLIVWDMPEAEDLVQETMFKVAKRWPRVRRMERPIAYARRILVNLALDGSDRRSRRQGELTGEKLPGRAEDPNAFEARDELLTALAELPPRQRAVLVLRYFLDLPEADVADALKCSVGTVKSSASRGLVRLQQSLTTRSIPT